MQALYQIDIVEKSIEDALKSVIAENKLTKEACEYAEKLLRGTYNNLNCIDEKIQKLSIDWPLDRMSLVDKNILRLASYEIIFEKETPHAVVANEAVELAKKYGGSESGKFINGILGSLIKEISKNKV